MTESKACPFCAGQISHKAKKCRHCRRFIDGSGGSDAALPAGVTPNGSDDRRRYGGLGGSGVAILFFFLPWVSVPGCNLSFSGADIAIGRAQVPKTPAEKQPIQYHHLYWLTPFMAVTGAAAILKGRHRLLPSLAGVVGALPLIHLVHAYSGLSAADKRLINIEPTFWISLSGVALLVLSPLFDVQRSPSSNGSGHSRGPGTGSEGSRETPNPDY